MDVNHTDAALRDIRNATNADQLSAAWEAYERSVAGESRREALTASVIREP
jgi:hypothetical protein